MPAKYTRGSYNNKRTLAESSTGECKIHTEGVGKSRERPFDRIREGIGAVRRQIGSPCVREGTTKTGAPEDCEY